MNPEQLLTPERLRIISRQKHPRLVLDDEAIETLQVIFGEFAQRLGQTPDNETSVREFLTSTLGKTQLSEQSFERYRRSRRVSDSLEYILSEVLELAGNRARDYRRRSIQQQDIIIVIIIDDELYQPFKNRLAPFPYISPLRKEFIEPEYYLDDVQVVELGKLLGIPLFERIPEDFLDERPEDFPDDIVDAIKNIGQAIALWYKDTSPYVLEPLTQRLIDSRDEKVIPPSRGTNPVNNLVREVLITVMKYAEQLAEEYHSPISYRILIHSSLTNPYLDEIPMADIFEMYMP